MEFTHQEKLVNYCNEMYMKCYDQQFYYIFKPFWILVRVYTDYKHSTVVVYF